MKPWFCLDCRVAMIFKDDGLYLKCPECGTEVWPEQSDIITNTDPVAELMRGKLRNHQPCECLPAGGPQFKANSKSRTKKSKSKKLPLVTLNQRLYGDT